MTLANYAEEYRRILEGKRPSEFLWKFGPACSSRSPRDKDFQKDRGQRILSTPPLIQRKPFASRGYEWLTTAYDDMEYTMEADGETDIFTWTIPEGRLIAKRKDNHMMEFPVKDLSDLALWHEIQKRLHYSASRKCREKSTAARKIFPFHWSPAQELIQFETGVENFHYFLCDDRQKVEALMETMHENTMEALAIGLEVHEKASVCLFNENTSSAIISPDQYRRYTLRHIRDYADLVHRSGKRLVVHMCGLLRQLISFFPETGMDGIHSVTPPPIGDTPYRLIRNRFGENFAIVGRINSQLLIGKSADDIRTLLTSLIDRNLVKSPFALWVSTDGMRIPRDDFLRATEVLYELQNDFAAGQAS